jgi:hypothetical protein
MKLDATARNAEGTRHPGRGESDDTFALIQGAVDEGYVGGHVFYFWDSD